MSRKKKEMEPTEKGKWGCCLLYKYVNRCQNSMDNQKKVIKKIRVQSSVDFGVDIPDAKNELAEIFGVGDAISVGDAGGYARICGG